jgi:putative membrane protein
LKLPDSGNWRRTSPLAVLFFLGKLVRDIVKNAWQSFAPLAALVIASSGDLIDRLKLAAIVAVIAMIIIAVLRYWFFRFQLAGDSILIREGVVKKKQLDIKFDRIQGINIEQNIVFRYFGLVTVNFDTAGSSGDEGNLPAVPREFAEALREKIGRTLALSPHVGRRAPTTNEGDDDASESQPLLQLDWRDMIKIGLSDKRALLFLAFLAPLSDRFDDNVERFIGETINEAASGTLQLDNMAGFAVVGGLFVAVVLVLLLASIAAAFLRYHKFELLLEDRTLRSHSGLLTRHEVSMDLGKIQTLRLQQGIILRWMQRFRMTARQARSSHRNTSSKNFTIPIVGADLATELRRRFLGTEGKGLVQIPSSDKFSLISPFVMRMPLLINVLGPLALSAVLYSQGQDPEVFGVLLWIPLSLFAIYRGWRHAGYLYTGEGFVRRSGVLAYRTVALLYRKVQRVTVSQSRFQRRKGLATLRVYMASGSVRIPYIEHELARQLQDYILYKVESSTKAWH